MKINGLPTFMKFKKVECPKCKRLCAMEFTTGPKEGMIQCASSDHITPCNYYGGGSHERQEKKRA